MKHRMFRTIGLIFIIMMVFSLTSPGAEPARAQGITLRIALDADPVTLDPTTQGFTRSSQFVHSQLFEGLFQYAEDGSIIPAGATGYDVSTNVDFDVYTIHLRQDAYWSDNTQVTAQQYVDALLHLSGWEYEFLIQDIVTVTAPNTYEITITVDHPSTYFPHILTIPHVYLLFVSIRIRLKDHILIMDPINWMSGSRTTTYR